MTHPNLMGRPGQDPPPPLLFRNPRARTYHLERAREQLVLALRQADAQGLGEETVR